MCRYSLCHVYIHQSSEAPFGFIIHLSTRLLPNFDSHVTKFVKLSLRSRQVYDHMLSIASIKSPSYFIAIRIDYCTLSSPSLHDMYCIVLGIKLNNLTQLKRRLRAAGQKADCFFLPPHSQANQSTTCGSHVWRPCLSRASTPSHF